MHSINKYIDIFKKNKLGQDLHKFYIKVKNKKIRIVVYICVCVCVFKK